ncbi:MAG: phosphatidate cytidylyltransferase, partial [Proteobacteria bacterium]|nr:phosphatidate cytidylyltransferase [Pseudomonadota bacterium]
LAAGSAGLAESLLKRAFEMKDSGSILPGHGGFLDRFDGVVFALPVMFAVLRIFTY